MVAIFIDNKMSIMVAIFIDDQLLFLLGGKSVPLLNILVLVKRMAQLFK